MGDKRQAVGSVGPAVGATDNPRRSGWVIGQNDFGGPMVEHQHADGRYVAHVLFGRNGNEFAQCASCGDRVPLGA